MEKHSTALSLKELGIKLFPLVLWLIPIIALNLGFRFLAGIDLYWQEKSQTEMALQELEALTGSSKFEYQLARHAGRFARQLDSASRFKEARTLENFLSARCKSIFARPFPEYQLYTFRQKLSQKSSDLVFSFNRKIVSNKALSLTFDYMRSLNFDEKLGETIAKQREKLVQKFFGMGTKGDVLALSQRGKTTYVLHRNIPHWFIWDFKKVSNDEIWGYFILSRFSNQKRVAAKLIALQECKERNRGLAGFIPLTPGQSGNILFERLSRSKLFKNWLKKEVPLLTENIRFWVKNNPPGPVKLGRYSLFTHLGRNRAYLSVFLAPTPVLKKIPTWIWLINLLLLPTIILLMLRGILFNQWVEMRLTFRFIMLYILAATMPLSLLAIASTGYLAQFNYSNQNQIVSTLNSCFNQYDARKSQIQDAYRTTALKIFNDRGLSKLIAEKGLKHQEVQDRILDYFKKRPDPLPLLGIYLLDLAGQGWQYYENISPERLDPNFEVFKSPILNAMRNNFAQKHPEIPLPDYKISEEEKFGALAYTAVCNNDLSEEIEKRRTYPIARRFGSYTATQIHDFLEVNGRKSVLIYIVWDDSRLDKRTLQATTDYLGLNYSRYIFTAYKNTPQGLEPMIKSSRHIGSDFIRNSMKVAESAISRGGSVQRKFAKYSILAKPSRKYSNIILVGGVDRYYLEMEEFSRRVFLFLIIFISFLILLLSAYFTAKLLLKPITNLKSALDEVSKGNLGLNLISKRKDELGELTRDFSVMIQGMRERKRLSALLSDQAIEAISSDSSDQSALLKPKEFNGIALVSDIRSFTTLCEKHSPEEITDLLNEHFAIMAEIIARNGGRIYKFIGDAIEAVFPISEDNQAALAAVKAAVEMHAANVELNRKRRLANKFTYDCGVGLAMGPLYSGGIGGQESRMDYAVIGEALTTAAELEALSKGSDQLPIVFDQKIRDKISDRFACKEIENEVLPGFTLLSESESVRQIFASHKITKTSQSQNKAEENTDKTGTYSGDSFTTKYATLMFLIFLSFALLIGAGVYFGFQFRNKTLIKTEVQKATTTIFSLAEQLKSEDASRIAFEMKMKRLIKRIERKLSWKPKLTEPGLIKNSVAAEIESMKTAGFPSSRAIAVYFNPEHLKSSDPDKLAEIAIKHQLSDDHARLLKIMACHQHNRFLGHSCGNMRNKFEPRLRDLFGRQINVSILATERFATAQSVLNNYREEYFYWNYITVYNPDLTEVSLENGTRKLAGCKKNDFRIVGMLMISVPVDITKHSPAFLAAGYDEPGYGFAIVSRDGKATRTNNFPNYEEGSITYTSKLPDYENYVCKEDVLRLGEKKYRLITSVKISNEKLTDLKQLFYLISLVLFATILSIYASIYQQTFITRSLGGKLWFSLLLIAIIPLITVMFMIDLFLFEHQKTMIAQEKIELQRFIDSFELRQYFFQPVAQHLLNSWSYSPIVFGALRKLDKNPHSKADYEILKNYLQTNFLKFEDPYGYASNFTPREVIIISKTGWVKGISRKDAKGMGEFGQMLGEIGKTILSKLQKNGQQKFSANMVKSEIYFDSCLETVRSSFGEDEYIKLANAVGEMVEMEVITGAAALQIQPIPSLDNPDYLLIWITMFSSGNYLTRIAERSNDKNAIFSLELHRYGILSEPDNVRGDLGLDKLSAWITSSNLPVSEERSYGDEKLLIEGRPGIAQFTNFFIAIGSQTQVLKEVNRLKSWFNRLLILSLLIILFIAHQTASDIIIPVKSLSSGMKEIDNQNFTYRINLDRKDELGQLCDSYDQLARGLAEKEMMGKMLSKNALESAIEDSSSKKGKNIDIAFIFIGIPGFASWLQTGTVDELFADLQKQTAEISRIIMDQGGDIDKFIGDKILGIFQISDSMQETLQKVETTARKLLQAEQSGLLPFPIAIGITYGRVISGFLGVGEKRDYTVIGDSVNISARIEKEAEKLRFRRCLLSENFVEKLPDRSAFRLHSEVVLKGKSAGLKLYEYR